LTDRVPSNEQPSRQIPEATKREVRKRCGFGCVVCGLPLYEYDHLIGWSATHEHKAEEITLLCNKHHRERTSGLLPTEDVVRANEDPHNLRSGVSKPYDLHLSGSECAIDIGSNVFDAKDPGPGIEMVALAIDLTPLVGFALVDGHLFLNLNVSDENNELVISILENQLMYSISPWDIELVGRRLRVRERPRHFFLDILFDPPNFVRIERARFLRNGVEVLVRPEEVRLSNGRTYHHNWIHGAGAGLVIGVGDPPGACAVRIHGVNRYPSDNPARSEWIEETFRGEPGEEPTATP
jgi:hypothetical protein